MRLLVPGGYMPDIARGALTVTICDGGTARQLALTIPGLGTRHDPPPEHGKAQPPCVFASLATQVTAAVDAILLLAALAYIIVHALRAAAIAKPRAVPYLRPPPRAPPAFR